MKTSVRFLLVIFISTIAFASCFSLTDSGINTVLKEFSNQQHNKNAILFLKEAGADSFQVTVADNDYKLDYSEVGNTFTCDDNHGETRLNSNSINCTWLSNDTLQIDFDKKLQTFIKNEKVEGVTVVYKEK